MAPSDDASGATGSSRNWLSDITAAVNNELKALDGSVASSPQLMHIAADSEASDDSWLTTMWESIEDDLKSGQREAREETIEFFKPPSPASAQSTTTLTTVSTDDMIRQHGGGGQLIDAGGNIIAQSSANGASLLSFELNVTDADNREIGRCVSCATEICVLIHHGAPRKRGLKKQGTEEVVPRLERPRVIDITCRACYENLDRSLPIKVVVRVKKVGRKKRNAVDWSTQVWCDACNHLTGYGGVREDFGDSGWHEPLHETEVICSNCVVDFKICGSCRGTTRFKSGMWRPRQMFLPGRQSCRLSHKILDRKPDIGYVTYLLPYMNSNATTWDLQPTFHHRPLEADPLQGLDPSRRVSQICENYLRTRWDTFFSMFDASYMRVVPEIWHWESLTEMFDKNTVVRLRMLTGHEREPTRGRMNVRRCVTFAHHKGVLTWRRGGGGDNSIEGEMAETANFTFEKTMPIIGYGLFEWYVDQKTVHFIDKTHRFELHLGNEILAGLQMSCFLRIEQDCAKYNVEPPDFIWYLISGRIDSEEGEYDFCPPYAPLKRYSRERGLDPAEVKKRMFREYNHEEYEDLKDHYMLYVLDWKDRAKVLDV